MEKMFERQDRFRDLMVEAYHTHTLPFWFAFTPYIQWKDGKSGFNITRTEMLGMRNVAQRCIEILDKKHPLAFENLESFDKENLFYPYNGYEGDSASMAFLSHIDEELTNLLILTSED